MKITVTWPLASATDAGQERRDRPTAPIWALTGVVTIVMPWRSIWLSRRWSVMHPGTAILKPKCPLEKTRTPAAIPVFFGHYTQHVGTTRGDDVETAEGRPFWPKELVMFLDNQLR